ncbi:hypothetical protein GGI04_003049 [Coemansia thaxteri]|nr:hypothetical protein GGI04_003049 [Coemansia thaxteri]KAJ2459598.1 hypothetical protein GGI02_005857 [Coemansia sp. RSA 2322]
MVLVALFDIATTLVYMHEGWAPVDGSGERLALAGSNGDGENARRIAHQAVLVWAMAAADCAAAGEQIEARLEPLITFLASRSADVECCKLHVQLLLVLCGCYEDEEKSMTAYEDATSALLKAHKLSPGDEDIKAQLADMGQPVN